MKHLTEAEHSELLSARMERDALLVQINNPQTAVFLTAVKFEAAHQRRRFGGSHDRNKSAENWFWLVGYLAGKALRAAIWGDKLKAKHHCVSSAAALAQWFEAIEQDESGSGIGADADLSAKEIP